MSKFNVWDTVKIVKVPVENFMTSDYPEMFVGYSGIIKCKNHRTDNYGIEFKEKLPNNFGHSCDGKCKNKCGLFISEKYLEKVEEKEMTKSDLNEFDVVQLRNGMIGMVFFNSTYDELCIFNPDFGSLKRVSSYRECNLIYKDRYSDYDIVKVYHTSKGERYNFLKCYFTKTFNKLSEITTKTWSWECEEIKEVTMQEIEEKFGCKVKIIREEN